MSNKDLLKTIENSSKNIEDKDENAEEKIKDIIGKNTYQQYRIIIIKYKKSRIYQ